MAGGETHVTDLVETRLEMAQAVSSTAARLAVGGPLERVELRDGGVAFREPNATASDMAAMAAASATAR